MSVIHSSSLKGRGNPPLRRLELVALAVPSALLGALIGLDYFVLEPLLPSPDAHIAMFVIGLAGVITFSITIFSRLAQLQARILAQVEAISALEQRNRIGIDLHDGAMQSLYGVSLVIEDAADRLSAKPADAERALRRAVDRLNATIADLRAYVLGLEPVSADGSVSLRDSLQALAASARSSALVEVTVAVDDAALDALDARSAENVFYIAAGAVANVVRHARARHADVRIARELDRVALTVADDGVGFDVAGTARGKGIPGIEDRVRSLGATFAIDSAPGHGTRIRVDIPAATLIA